MFLPCGPPESQLYWFLTYVGAVPAAAAPPDEEVLVEVPWALAPVLLPDMSMLRLSANSPPFCADSAAREPETLPAPSCVTGALSPRVTWVCQPVCSNQGHWPSVKRCFLKLTLVPSLGAFPTILNVSANLMLLFEDGVLVVGDLVKMKSCL